MMKGDLLTPVNPPAPHSNPSKLRRRLPERKPDYCKVCDRLAQAEDMLVAGQNEQAAIQLALAQAGALAVMTESLLIATGSLLEIEKRLDNLGAIQSTPAVMAQHG